MPVERQLDRVSPQLQSLNGLCQADKDVSGSQGKHVVNITNESKGTYSLYMRVYTADNIHILHYFFAIIQFYTIHLIRYTCLSITTTLGHILIKQT